MALQPRTRRDTPAQDDKFRRDQETFRKDISALQSAGLSAQDRSNENDAIANVVRNTTSTMPDNFGNSGSPTLREAGRGAVEGVRSGAQATQQWRSDALRADTAGGEAYPSASDTLSRLRSNSPPAMRGAGPQTMEASRTPGTQTGGAGTLRSALGAVGEFMGSRGQTGGFTERSALNPTGRGVTPDRRIDFDAPISFGSRQPSTAVSGRGTNTPSRPQQPSPSLNSSALDTAQNVGAGTGYAIGPDGSTQFVPGTQRNTSGISVMGNMGRANEEFARANAIRQEMIDSQRPQNQVTVLGGAGAGNGGAIQGAGGVDQQIQRLVRSAGSTNDPWQRAAINRQISQLQSLAGRQEDRRAAQATNDTTLQAQQLRNQGALATTLAGQTPDSVNPYDVARAQQVRQEMQEGDQAAYPTYDPDEIEAILAMPNEQMQQVALQQYAQRQDRQFAEARLDSLLGGASRQDALESYQSGDLAPDSELGMLIQQLYGGEQTEDFADGGLVPEFSALGFAQGGMVPDQYGAQMGPGMDMGSAVGMGAPGSQGIDLMQMEYDQYAQGAERLGVPAVPFEEFIGLKQQAIPQPQAAPGAAQPMTGALQSAVKMAEGGMVPGQDPSDTSGMMIVDSDPDAPEDSIPAVIDGQRPAKLDSGEFVLPRDVVMFFGTDKLNKMIEQAQQKGQGNGAQPGSASAVQQSASSAGR